MDADVTIVGAGPVGLTAALCLARAGLKTLVLEADERPSTEWRASTFHAPTLEMCEDIEIVDEMIERGVVCAKYQVRDWRQGRIAEFDFTALADETKYPYRLQLEQYKYSEIIRDRLARLDNAEIRFGVRLTEIADTEPKVIFTAESADGAREMSSRWLVGSDGSNSAVRSVLKLGFEGLTYPSRILILSIEAPLDEWFPSICYVNYIADSQDSPGMLLRIPDLWRVSFQLPDDVSDEQARSDEYIAARMKAVFGERDIPLSKSRQIFRTHQRVADTFRVGHVVLVGDAAHINTPFGGMGLNSGIHDAYHLGAILPGVIRGTKPDEALTEWAEKRRSVALHDIRRITHRNASDLQEKDDAKINATLERYSAIANDPVKAREWMREASMLTSVRAQGIPSQQPAQSAH